MASDDKTHCGKGEVSDIAAGPVQDIHALAKILRVSPEQISEAILEVGDDARDVEAFFRSKGNVY